MSDYIVFDFNLFFSLQKEKSLNSQIVNVNQGDLTDNDVIEDSIKQSINQPESNEKSEEKIISSFNNEKLNQNKENVEKNSDNEEIKTKNKIEYHPEAIAAYELGMSKINNSHGAKDYKSAYQNFHKAANLGMIFLLLILKKSKNWNLFNYFNRTYRSSGRNRYWYLVW